jgi:4-hydroxy-tetrahydrodipicolinate synthase
MTAAAVAGEVSKARQIHDRYFELFKNLFIETNPIPVKTALKKMGMYNGEMRLPMCEMSAANEEKLVKTLKACQIV